MLLPLQQDTCWEEPYFCCGFILGLGSGQFIFLFVSLSVLIKMKKRMFIVLFFAFFFLNACQEVHLVGVGGCSREVSESMESCRHGGHGGKC